MKKLTFLVIVLFLNIAIIAQGFTAIPIRGKLDTDLSQSKIRNLIEKLSQTKALSTDTTEIDDTVDLKDNLQANTYDFFLPIKNKERASEFWGIDGIKALTSANTTVNDKVFSSNIEVFSDIISVLRLSLGLSLTSNSSTDDSTMNSNRKQPTITRLIQSGGTINISAIYPFLFLSHNLSNTDEESGLLTSLIRISLGWDSPKLDEFVQNPGISGTAGIELSGFYTGTNLGLDFGLSFNEHYFNSHYQKRIEVENEWGNILIYKFGVIIARKTRLGVTGSIAGSSFMKDYYGLRAYLTQTIEF